MVYQPRPYRDERDLAGMWRVLQDGRRSGGPTYYVHIGDLNWWLFYLNQDQDPRQRIYLWDRSGAGVEGWALFSPRFRAFDVFVHPNESARVEGMLLWAEEQMAGLVRAQGGHELCTMWISEHDTRVRAHLESCGFERSGDHLRYLMRSLEGPLAESYLPPGYVVRHVAGEQEARRRAAVSHAAFASNQPFDAYVQRTLAFMRCPVYRPELDLVVIGQDGQFASFCICWLDDQNRVGHFEPVGTHPEFRRKGLGQAVLWEGMRRMQAHGMATAGVCVGHDNPAAKALYESVGFRLAQNIHTYTKAI